MMRAIRFASQLQFAIEEKTYAAIRESAHSHPHYFAGAHYR